MANEFFHVTVKEVYFERLARLTLSVMQWNAENEVYPGLYAGGMAICLPQEAVSVSVSEQH